MIDRFAQAVARLEVDGDWLVEELTQHLRSMQPNDSSLPNEDRKLLLAGVASSLEMPIDREASAIGRGDLHLKIVRTWLNSVCATLFVDETKAFIQIDDEELMRRGESRHLVPIKLNGQLRFLEWQFGARNPPMKTIRNLPEFFESLEDSAALRQLARARNQRRLSMAAPLVAASTGPSPQRGPVRRCSFV